MTGLVASAALLVWWTTRIRRTHYSGPTLIREYDEPNETLTGEGSPPMREPLILSCAAFVYMGVAMWAIHPAPSCQLSIGPQRRLYLDRVMDRDLIDRQARRIREISAREAQRAGNAEGIACAARLGAELAARHGVRIDVVRLALDRVW